MFLWIASSIALICVAVFIFAFRRNPSTLFILVEWSASFIISLLLIYDYLIIGNFKYVIGPLVPIVLFVIFSLYLKSKPIKSLLYTYIAFWLISFVNYLSYILKKDALNEFVMIDLGWFTADTYFVLTVTIMLIQLYIAFKSDRRGNFSRSDCDNTLHNKRCLDDNRYARI